MSANIIKAMVAVGMIAGLIACTGGGSSSSSSSQNRTYQAAGSRWTVEFTDSTFDLNMFSTLAATTASMTITGSVEQNATNLFKTMTVESATGSGAPNQGDTAIALEMVGAATFIQPFGSDTPLVATVISTCPSSDFNANWVISKPSVDSNGDFATNTFDTDGAGTAVFDQSDDKFAVKSSGIVDGVLASSGNEFTSFGMGTTCSAGKLPVSSGGEEFDMYFTPSGQIVVKFPDAMGNQIISGFPQTESAVTATAMDGTYSALVYVGGNAIDASQADVLAAKITLNSGSGAITRITDIQNNTEAGSPVFNLGSFSNQDNSSDPMPNGQFRLALSGGAEGNGNGQLTCMTTDSTPRALACYGFYNTGSNASGDRRPITVLGRIR